MFVTRLAILVVFLVGALADGHDLTALQACAAEKEDAKRLRCYDTSMATPATSAPQTSAPSPPDFAVMGKMEKEFGYSDVQARATSQEAAANQLEQLNATITQVVKRTHGELVLTLDNGQVWEEKAVSSLSRTLTKGDHITIKRGALGSFYLVSNSKRSTQVDRVR
jgi:hypothetical protein